MPKIKEKRVTVKFEGWDIDIFICDNGDLGFTVMEFGRNSEDETAKCVDIFVDKTEVGAVHSC